VRVESSRYDRVRRLNGSDVRRESGAGEHHVNRVANGTPHARKTTNLAASDRSSAVARLKEAEMAKDPVCGMQVSEQQA
jgi:hypothetical protein